MSDLTDSNDAGSDLEARLASVLSGEISSESPEGIEILREAQAGPSPLITAEELTGLEALAEAFEYHGMPAEELSAADGEPPIDMQAMLKRAIESEDTQQSQSGGGGAPVLSGPGSSPTHTAGSSSGASHASRADTSETGPSGGPRWRVLATAAALLIVGVLAFQLGKADGGPAADPSGRGPILGSADTSTLKIVVDASGAERIQLSGLPEALDPFRDELLFELQTRDASGAWKTLYEGDLGSGGFLLEGDLVAAKKETLRWRGTIHGNSDAPLWSSGWIRNN